MDYSIQPQGVGCLKPPLACAQESLAQQENSLGRGYSEVLGELAARAAQVPLQLPGAAGGGAAKQLRTWDSPDVLGKLDALCALNLLARLLPSLLAY